MRPLLAVPLLLAALAEAKMIQKPVAYSAEKASLEGVLIYDDAVKAARPGLVLVPNWLGINPDNLAQAEKVAGMGFVVFVADLYGKGGGPKSQEEAGKAAGALKADRARVRTLMKAALEALKTSGKAAKLDEKRLGAIGFCLGGTAAIELARSGASVAGVVSFHGGLDAPAPPDGKIVAKVLALHGAEDPAVPPEGVKAFQDDMRKAGVDWQLVSYGGAVHSFTDVKANNPPRSVYDEKTATRAYAAMRAFFDEAFSAP